MAMVMAAGKRMTKREMRGEVVGREANVGPYRLPRDSGCTFRVYNSPLVLTWVVRLTFRDFLSLLGFTQLYRMPQKKAKSELDTVNVF